MTNSWRDSRR